VTSCCGRTFVCRLFTPRGPETQGDSVNNIYVKNIALAGVGVTHYRSERTVHPSFDFFGAFRYVFHPLIAYKTFLCLVKIFIWVEWPGMHTQLETLIKIFTLKASVISPERLPEDKRIQSRFSKIFRYCGAPSSHYFYTPSPLKIVLTLYRRNVCVLCKHSVRTAQ
jgi:hypothetical protein